MSTPFIVHGLPRSRTAWLSRFLSYGGWTCWHEMAITMRSVEDIKAFFSRPCVGAAETAAAAGWLILEHHVPGIRTVVVRRPVEDVVRSLLNIDLGGVATYDAEKLRFGMERGARALERISQRPGVLTVDFDDLNREDACAAIFEHCLPFEFNPEWWELLSNERVEVDVKPFIAYYRSHLDEIEGFKRACKKELRKLVACRAMQTQPVGGASAVL